MAAKKKQTALSTAIMLVVILTFVCTRYQEINEGQGSELAEVVQSEVPSTAGSSQGEAPLTKVKLSSSRYQIWEDCMMIDHRGNDGDSFHIQAPHGREEIRIYFVDAPESAARSYRDGNTNHARIAQQGAAMGGLNQAQTTKLGTAAKAFVKQLLAGKRFTVVTNSERVYNSHRKYAFVIVDWKGQPHYLHELLVVHGLGRIHTKPVNLPDNTSASKQKQHLRNLETYAKRMRYGAWAVVGK
jgi:endonuclease YncB( thermonuclease family)